MKKSKREEPKKQGAPSLRLHSGARVGQREPLSVQHLVQIEKPVYGGSFLAHLEGKAVFVPLTLPGEQASIRITQNKSG
jgi:predicted RNA-binding protein with TRAM domain